MDISADLTELARTPVAVICAGAKSVRRKHECRSMGWRCGVHKACNFVSADFPSCHAFFCLTAAICAGRSWTSPVRSSSSRLTAWPSPPTGPTNSPPSSRHAAAAGLLAEQTRRSSE